MNFKQFYLGCLSHASYYIGSDGEAAVIDPQRDVQQYLDEAEANGQKIKYIIETHSHADFVSGHLELAKKTGAQIVYGYRADVKFPALKVKDGDELMVGKVKLKFLETPGHTPEAITVLAQDTENPDAPLKMFTGDTLFIGDVGRPDLVGSKGYTAEQMASMLYDSLHNKILQLPDDTEVYPAHGAGSLCGKSLAKETWSTLGEQKKVNYALKPMTKEEFIKLVTADQPEIPMYFPKSAARNLEGAPSLEELPRPKQMDTEEVMKFEGAILDVRSNAEYGEGHISNSINIGLGGQFASWAGTLIPIGTPIVIVAKTKEQVDEAFMRLARVGHESAVGYILIDDFKGEKKSIPQVSVQEAKVATENPDVQLVDVRRVHEYLSGHAPRAINIPLHELPEKLDQLDKEKKTYVICGSGYRSSIGTSILEKAGFKEVFNVAGGTTAWIRAGLEVEIPSNTACVS
ncbi:MAG: MBL fold metallo-hydrolase [Acidobacteria bacterium]|jgi:glyoxylase-like metal-dependent hydrolase (beta-lactamase superfamily II)/rhodanese-related sulfurtransferase|nr:MAG: MBL fold metallo-hydrolase [Acidobacteriota bacterium]GIU80975.1 MAG: MBL fold hydrolase [Pyrinomonadaceae bacterium]